MTGMPPIPDRAISFQEMGELMNSYDEAAPTQPCPNQPATRRPARERAQWSQMEARAEEEYKRTENEYELLVRQLTGALGTE
jgi:hypothetical protein